MDHTEPRWRINSSFSPPLSRRWDCRSRSDGVSHETHGAPMSGSSLSSHSKGTRSVASSDQYPNNHHYSMSDGALSYFGSPYDSIQAPRWTPPSQRFDLGEFSTPTGGARPKNSVFTQCNERAGASSVSNSLGSASPPSESSRWGSTGKQPILYPPRHYSGRRSFMSKPVYPLMFRNPVSDGSAETPVSLEGASSPELKFHKALSELQRTEPGVSFRREGFRWSSASSYDLGFDAVDITEHPGRSPNQKCGLCERLLSQKSPWSSHRIVRSGDMPVAGVLPCRHVFHADCLEETTPKAQIHDPPCPLCMESLSSFSEPLQLPPPNPSPSEGEFRRNQSRSLIKNHFKKRFSFKGKAGKIFGRPSSSRDEWNQRARQSSRLSGR